MIPGPGNGTSQLPRNELLRRSTRKSTRSRSGQQAAASGANMRYAGDLFTKVSIGRTKSFVKTGNQYNLQELFRELKVCKIVFIQILEDDWSDFIHLIISLDYL